MNNCSTVDVYDCWLQSGRTVPAEMARRLGRVCAMDGDAVTLNAAEQLRWGLDHCFGLRCEAAADASAPCVVLGDAAWVREKTGIELTPPPAEGFCIAAEKNCVAVAGGDGRGMLYGVLRLLRELALGALADGARIEDAPRCQWRFLNHWDNIDGSIERGYAGKSLFFQDGAFVRDEGRIRDYARLLASVGINSLCVNNVNVRGGARRLILDENLPEVARVAGLLRPFGIRMFLSVNFAAPYTLGGLPTADPCDETVGSWWARRCAAIWKAVPDLGGFVVKADSEHEPGPFDYGRTHADGANMLARAMKDHGGTVVWRCFVYNCAQDWRDPSIDRARAAYDHFMPLDGQFDDNVFLQIKNGPYDFQVSEPVSPLFGALQKTKHLLELQVTQEYTGHQIDLCYLAPLWRDVLDFDTKHGENAAVAGMIGNRIAGVAAVGNVGDDRCWTGNPLAQANLYAYGRLTWNPDLSSEAIAREWSRLTLGDTRAAGVAERLLLGSYATYAKYNAPFGVCFMVTRSLHYGPGIEDYEYSRWGTYHRANFEAVGIDRTPAGTGYTDQYAPQNAAMFADIHACPERLLLFFHRVRYDFVMKNGKTLLQNIYDTHFEGADEVRAMIEEWKSLAGELPPELYETVLERFGRQLVNAEEWRDQINTYFHRYAGVPDALGRKIYD